MDVKYINPVLQSMLNVLTTMARLQPKVGKPTLKTDQAARGDVSGIMTMESPQARGSMAITFTRPVICDIVKRMLGQDISEIDDTARDLTGEMTNMVVGGAKNILVNQGYEFSMSLPSVVSGKGHHVEHKYSGRTVLLPFKTDAGEFFVEICFEE